MNKVEIAENRLAARVLAEARRRRFFSSGSGLVKESFTASNPFGWFVFKEVALT
jgi:hypothetical protein